MTPRLIVTFQISDGSVRSLDEDNLKRWRDKSVSKQRLIHLDYQLRAVPGTCGLAVILLVIAGCWAEFSVPVLFFIILFAILGIVCFVIDNID